MNCIIIDDETSSRQLEEFVSRCSSLNLVGTFNDSVSAIDQLSKRDNIDLAFIDIKSAGPDSFDLIGSLGNPPNIIVISDTGQYASKAFDYDVVDYLLKPVNYSRFSRAVDRTLRISTQKILPSIADKEVFIKKDSSLIKVKMKDIIYVEALENYVIVVTRDKKFTILYTMKGMENQLPSEVFIRVHRSFIVNKRMIKTINECSLDLIVGNELKNLPVGKSFRSVLLSDINVMDRKNLSPQNNNNNINYPVDLPDDRHRRA
jgi:DNA-binding LytR/AlgR family response regulator